MPSIAPLEAWNDWSMRRESRRHHRDLCARVFRTMHLEHERDEVQKQLAATAATNPPAWNPENTRHTALMLTMLAAIPAAWWIDFFLLSSLTRVFVNGAFPPNSALMWIARAGIPAAIVITEIAGATVLMTNYEQKRWGKFSLWLAFAVALCVAVPAAYVGSAYARQSAAVAAASAGAGANAAVDPDRCILGLEPKLFWPTLTISLIALVVHGGLLAGGAEAHGAKAALFYRRRKTRLEARARAIQEAYRNEGTQVAGTFRTYAGLVANHNARSARRINAGPFPLAVALWLNRFFGQTVIELPPGHMIGGVDAAEPPTPGVFDADGNPQRAEATPSPEAGLEAELSYIQSLQERRIRDDESELRP